MIRWRTSAAIIASGAWTEFADVALDGRPNPTPSHWVVLIGGWCVIGLVFGYLQKRFSPTNDQNDFR